MKPLLEKRPLQAAGAPITSPASSVPESLQESHEGTPSNVVGQLGVRKAQLGSPAVGSGAGGELGMPSGLFLLQVCLPFLIEGICAP